MELHQHGGDIKREVCISDTSSTLPQAFSSYLRRSIAL